MRGLESIMKWLRTLVETKEWDYCVVWKLGDDPSRFIQWMECCCSGGYICVETEKESRVPFTNNLCRDNWITHCRRTEACEALAHFPSFFSLYSGMHGDVVLSNQPKWLPHVNASHTSSSYKDESNGTRVLIPVVGGLIELFAAKHITMDEKIVKIVTAHCNFSSEPNFLTDESSIGVNFNEQWHIVDPSFEDYSQKWLTLPLLTSMSNLQMDSSPLTCKGSAKKSSCFDSYSGFTSQYEPLKKDNAKAEKRKGNELFVSRNLDAERNRRNRINERLLALRALVPKISKMDKASIIQDAFNYIKELQEEIEKLQNDLKEIDEECCKKNKEESKIPFPNGLHMFSMRKKKSMEVKLEVNRLDKRKFFIKLLCGKKRCGFRKLTEALGSLGLQAVDVNITTFHNQVLSSLKVEANKDDVELKDIEESLMKLTDRQVMCLHETEKQVSEWELFGRRTSGV